jgi:lipopolysaccharide export LptBFGC system permease protein LptF
MIVGIVLLVMTVPQLARVNTTLAMAANWLYLLASLLAVFGYWLFRQKQDVTSEYEKLGYIAWIWGINIIFMLGGAFYLLSWTIKKWLTQ